MTIPASSNWCPDCNEACHGHPTICTVCGAALTNPPTSSSSTTTTTSTSRTRPIPESVTNQLRTSSLEFRNELSSLRARMEAIRSEQDEMRQFLQNRVQPDWDNLLLGVLNDATSINLLGNTENSSSAVAATASVVLDALPRIDFTSDNTVFQQCALEFKLDDTRTLATQESKKYVIPAIPGEFCNWSNMKNNSNESIQHQLNMSNLVLVVADGSGTGEGGTISNHTLQTIQIVTKQHRSRVILFMNRGGGLSFVQKAMLSQKAGASVCVIGNHLPDGPWPYTMCDSTNEASTLGVVIPTVMISYPHGQRLQKMYREQQSCQKLISATMVVQSKDHMECCICTEAYTTGCKIIQIQPGCGHYFHEACVLQWLSIHNTCPFCRFALPFEDDEMERHRLIQLRQQESIRSGNNATDDFYG